MRVFGLGNRTRWALGVMDFDPSNAGDTHPFVVGSHATRDKHTDFHFGALWDDGPQVFGGIDRRLGGDFVLCADYTTGTEGMATVGVDYAVGDSVDLLVGAIRPNPGGLQLYTSLSFGLHW
jgi:hypothetical protein